MSCVELQYIRKLKFVNIMVKNLWDDNYNPDLSGWHPWPQQICVPDFGLVIFQTNNRLNQTSLKPDKTRPTWINLSID